MDRFYFEFLQEHNKESPFLITKYWFSYVPLLLFLRINLLISLFALLSIFIRFCCDVILIGKVLVIVASPEVETPFFNVIVGVALSTAKSPSTFKSPWLSVEKALLLLGFSRG